MNLEQWVSSTLKNYQEKHKPKKSEVKHVMDFLKAHPAEKLQRASYPQVLIKALAWTKTLNKKSKGLREAGKIEVIHTFSNGFQYVRLVDQTAKKWEGMHMGHCVASYTQSEGIYSLRDGEHFPHATFEIERNTLRQLSGKANGAVAPKYVWMLPKCLEGIKCPSDILENEFCPVKESTAKFLTEFCSAKPFIINSQNYLPRGFKIKITKPLPEKASLILKDLLENQVELSFESIMAFAKTGSKLYTKEYQDYFEDNFKAEELKVIYIADKQDDRYMWDRINYVTMSPKVKDFITENFNPVSIIQSGAKFFFPDEEQLVLKKSFTCEDEEIFKFVLRTKLCDEAVLEFGRQGISAQLNSMEQDILDMVMGSFEMIPAKFATFLEEHFEGVVIYSFNNKKYVMTKREQAMGKLKKPVSSKSAEFASLVLKSYFSEEALVGFIKAGSLNLKELGNFALTRAEYMNSPRLASLVLESGFSDQEAIYQVLTKACRSQRLEIIKVLLPHAKANPKASSKCIYQSAEAGKDFMKKVITLFKAAGHEVKVSPKDTYSYQWKPQSI